MKKVIPVFLLVALSLSVLTPLPVQAAMFPDVPDGFWAQFYIEALAQNGIISGKPDGKFYPNEPVTRGQFALMLYRIIEKSPDEPPEGTKTFPDVDPNTQLGKAVSAIVELGVARGYPDGTFRPNQPITRGQMAVMITRFLGGEETAIKYYKYADLPFKDKFVESQRGYIKYVYEYGIMGGTSKTTFSAGKPATRAQTAVILYQTQTLYGQNNLPRWGVL